MRMEELENSQYIKGTDTVERYLLELIRTYFQHSNTAMVNSKEFIIKRAVSRMKEEFQYENIGVLDVTYPDGVARTGHVTVTVQDLNAEPAIGSKHTAFNVDFGSTAGTACEGNDPRLNNKRDPLPHTHFIQEIAGLEGRLSSLLSRINRINNNPHAHNNMRVLDMLKYTGNSSVIDLTFIDTAKTSFDTELQNVKNDLDTLTNVTIPNLINIIQQQLTDTKNKIDAANNTIVAVHDGYLNQAKQYTDTEMAKVANQYTNSFAGYVTETQLGSIVKDSISYVGSLVYPCRSMFFASTQVSHGNYNYITDIPQDIIDELTARHVTLQDCIIDFLVRKKIDDGINIRYTYTKTPQYYFNDDGSINGILYTGIDYGQKKFMITYRQVNLTNEVTEEVKDVVIEIRLYSKRDVTAI